MNKKALKGQISLIGEVNDFNLVHQPHIERSDQGEAVTVIRVPARFARDPMYVSLALKAAQELARGAKSYKLAYRTKHKKVLAKV